MGERLSRAAGEHLEPGWACLKTSGETEVDSAICADVPEHCITSFGRYIILLQHETGRLAILTHRGTHARGETGSAKDAPFKGISAPSVPLSFFLLLPVYCVAGES